MKNRIAVALSVAAILTSLLLDLMLIGLLPGGESRWLVLLQDLLLLCGIAGVIHYLAFIHLKDAGDLFLGMIKNDKIDLHVRMDETLKGPVGLLMKGINQGMSKTEEAIGQVCASASRLVPMSRELADTYNSVSQAAIVHSSHSDSVVRSMEDLLTTAGVVTEYADKIAVVVDQGRSCATASRQVIEQTAQSMEQLGSRIDQADTEIDVLLQDSERISAIVEVIKSVADQTNLLALNAAIEAARAGTHGRGFAVVADEVRTLASRTRQSTDEIQEMVGRIQAGTHRVVDAMRLGREAAAETIAKTEESQAQMDNIVQSVHAIGEIAQAIATAADQQLSSSKQARTSVISMVELNAAAIESANNHAVSTTDLLKLAESLKEKMARFESIRDRHWDESMRPDKRKERSLESTTVSQSQPVKDDNIELF